MKTRQILTLFMLLWACSAYSQLNFLYMTGVTLEDSNNGFVIDRSLKKAWLLDGDSNDPYTITKYSKSGNTETMTLKEDDTVYLYDDGTKKVYPGTTVSEFTFTLDPKTQLIVKGKEVRKTVYQGKVCDSTTHNYNIKNLTCDTEVPRVVKFFKELAEDIKSGKPQPVLPSSEKNKDIDDDNDDDDAPSTGAKSSKSANSIDKAKDAAKNAAKETIGKMKGLLKKK